MRAAPLTKAPRAPGFAYLAISAATLVLVGSLALNAEQAPPPTVAEFAPTAQEQITDAPPDQGSTTVDGPGDGSGPLGPLASLSPTAQPSPTLTTAPRNRRCFGDPPRQTEDPQSPPCVDYWDPKSDNGRATSPGVTADSITIAWPFTIEKPRDTEILADYFNQRYQFYGRKLVLKRYEPRGGVFGPVDPQAMRGDADFVHDQIKAFASLAYIPKAGAEHHYYDRLAQHKIIGIDSHASQRTEAHYTRFAPYEWNYLPAFDTMMRNYGEWICKTLAGGAPEHAGTGISGRAERVFGIAYHRAADQSAPDVELITRLLNDCGIEPAATVEISNASQVILRFVEQRVTSVICLCQGGHYFDVLMPEATRQAFFPEWLVSSYHYIDYDGVGQKFPPEHAEHAFGITFHNKWLPQKDMPWYQAIKEADPNYSTGDDGYASAAYERYYELLLLASGIQMAGPNLTPQTFQQGMFKARFPAKGSGRAPLFEVGGGFGPGDHSWADDAAVIWYSPTGPSYTTNQRRGTYCYVEHGRRWGIGQWPRGPMPLFEGDCK